MVSTARPAARPTPIQPTPTSGMPAAIIAVPSTARQSQKVPKNSAKSLRAIVQEPPWLFPTRLRPSAAPSQGESRAWRFAPDLAVARSVQPDVCEEALGAGLIVVAAGIVPDRAVGVAFADEIGAAQIFHAVAQVRVGIEQAGGGAAVAHRPGGVVADLHEAVIRTIAGARVVAALAHDDAPD